MTNEIADGSVETPIDWEARARKAEAKIVDLKTSDKEEKKEGEKEEKETKADVDNKEGEADNTTTDANEALLKRIEALESNNKKLQEEAEFNNNQTTSNKMSMSSDARVTTGFDALSIKDYSWLSPAGKREYMSKSMQANWWDVVFN